MKTLLALLLALALLATASAQFIPSGKKISELPAASSVSGTSLFEVSNSGVSQKATGAQIAAFIGSGGTWGTITGALSSQTDLQSALDAKLSTAAAAGLYQPLDADLTSIAALATTAYGRSLLTSADGAAAKGLLGLGNVENTALSTWGGSAHIGTLGTIGAGTWQGGTIAPSYGGTGQTSLGDTADVLSIPQPAGAWAMTTVYSQGDLVSSAGAYYLCTASHTSSPSDEPGVGVNYASYWSVFVVSGGISDGDKGDIVVSGGGATYSVDSAVKSTGGNGSSDNGKLVVYNSNGSLRSAIVELPGAGVVGGQLSIYNTANTAAGTLRFSGTSNHTVWLPTAGNLLTDLSTISLARLADGGATAGQVLAWNGTQYAPATVSGASPAGSGSELQYRSGASTFGAVTGSSVSGGAITLGTNGAASTPPLSLSGTWYTGGTSTTTKPQLLIEPSGTTSTSWSTNGTGLGINAASGFTGKLIDAKVNGTTAFSYTYNSGTRGLLSLGSSGGAAISIYADPGKVSFASSVQATNGTFYVSSDYADSSGAFVSRNYSETTTHFVLASDGDAVAATLQLGLDHSTTPTGQTIKAHDVTTGTGASLTLAGGKGSVAGGGLVLATSTTNGAPAARLTVKASGVLNAAGMPTSSAGLASGDLWNDGGVVKIVP